MIKFWQKCMFLILFLGVFCYVYGDINDQAGVEHGETFFGSNLSDFDSLMVNDSEGISFHPPASSFAFMMIQMIGMLIFLSIVLYVGLYFFKKLNAKFKNKNHSVGFKIHENVYFSSKQGLSAVSFGKKVYIVGFSPSSVSLIDVIEDDEIVSSFRDANKANQANFPNMLKSFFNPTSRSPHQGQ